jgi:hypothetical protein
MIAEDIDVSVVFLEQILEEPHCEVKHEKPTIAEWCDPCTHQVTATLLHSCNGKSGSICQGTVVSILRIPLEGTTRKIVCIACRRPVQDCWRVIPKGGS